MRQQTAAVALASAFMVGCAAPLQASSRTR